MLKTNKHLNNNQPFVFFFNMIYITYSDYLDLKNFSKGLNSLFIKKNDLFFFITPTLSYLIFKNFLEFILFNDKINYVSKSNKKNYKLEFFPVKLKFLYCKFEEYILTREYLFRLFQFFKMYEQLIEQNFLFLLLMKIFVNLYVYFYNRLGLIK